MFFLKNPEKRLFLCICDVCKCPLHKAPGFRKSGNRTRMIGIMHNAFTQRQPCAKSRRRSASGFISYAAASSIFSTKIPFPVAGSSTGTCTNRRCQPFLCFISSPAASTGFEPRSARRRRRTWDWPGPVEHKIPPAGADNPHPSSSAGPGYSDPPD